MPISAPVYVGCVESFVLGLEVERFSATLADSTLGMFGC